MMAMMICLGDFPLSRSRSANVLSRGLLVRAVMAGMKSARLSAADPTLVMGVRVRPDVPLV